MKICLSFILSMFVFLAGFAKGPSLHYCYLSGKISAELHGMFSYEEEDACAKDKVKEDTCCAIANLSPLKGNCCEDFSLDVKLSDYSQNVNTYTPQTLFVAVFASNPYWFSSILPIEELLDANTYFDLGKILVPSVPLFLKNSVFRI